MHLFKLIIAHAMQWLAYNNIRASLVLILVSTMGFSDLNAFTNLYKPKSCVLLTHLNFYLKLLLGVR